LERPGGKSYVFGRLDRCLKVSLLEEHVGEPISLEERSSERISERNCLSGEVRGGPWTWRPSGREQPMGEEGCAHAVGGSTSSGAV